jgi:acyl carrier protein
LTPSGKIDRKALVKMDGVELAPEESYIAPRTPVEEDLVRMWKELLGLNRVGIHDNFFLLGGHSLIATQIAARVRERYHIELPLQSLFQKPTVAGLALIIVQALAELEGKEELENLIAEVEAFSEKETLQLLEDMDSV